MSTAEKLWLLVSQTVNALFFRGMPDESLSARSYRESWLKAIRRIDRVLGYEHCKRCYLQQKDRQTKRHQVEVM